MELTDEQKKQLEEQKAQCPFCKIIKGEIPAEKIYEDDKIFAILDINPASEGHILVMTKEHYPILPLIPKEEFESLIKATKLIENKAKKSVLLCDSANIFIANGGAAGQQSPHFMLHIIPRPNDSKLTCFKLKEQEINKSNQNKLYDILKQNIPQLMGEQYQKFKIEEQTEIKTEKIEPETILKLLNENPKLKEMIIKETEKAKDFINNNEKLKLLFESFNIDKLAEYLKSQEQKSNLDKISGLFEDGKPK